MKLLKLCCLLCAMNLLNSCASGYKAINLQTLNYLSKTENNGLSIAYKYNLLDKKYAKKELKKGIKLIAVKLTNNSDKDYVIGKDIKFTYNNNREVSLINNEEIFKYLKQSPASYLWYLLLTPVNFYTSETDSNGFSRQTSSTPVGLVLGPGLAGGNMIAAGSANKKFKTDLFRYNINGSTIQKGETVYGLIGVRSTTYNAITITVNE